jgi:ABC-2 type transport system permease protein
MTILTTPSSDTTTAHPPGHSSLKVTQGRVLRSELTKMLSLRSTVWTLLVSVVLTVGIGALLSAVTASQFDKFEPAQRATFDAVSTSLSGITFAQLAIGVLGVLLISGEYSTGMIRSSLTVVPARLPVLWAKIAVFAGVVFVISLIAAFAAFFLGQSLLSGHQLNVSLSAPGALRSVIGSALYVTVAGVIALALGALLRSTAAGISTFVGAFFVLPPLTQLLPSSWADHFVQYLPSTAGGGLFSRGFGIAHPLAPWTGFAVLCGYAAVLIAAAAWSLRRRDA